MTKFRELDSIDEEHPLLDGERVRTSLTMMDSVQRAVAMDSVTAQQSIIDQETIILDSGLPRGLHRPGYRYTATDAAAVTRVQMARDEYERDLCSRWQTAAPGPTVDDSAQIIDAEFDDCYQEYEHRLQNAYKGGNS